MNAPRFSGIRTFMGLPHQPGADDLDVAVLGVPFDTGETFRVGARFGPQSLREASLLLRPYHAHHGVDVGTTLRMADLGDVAVVPGYAAESYEQIATGLSGVLNGSEPPFLLLLGGDCSIALPTLRALHAVHGPMAVVHFDAHVDTWDEYWGQPYTHGTPFRRAVEEGLIDTGASSQVGIRGPLYSPEDVTQSQDLGFEVVTADRFRELGPAAVADLVAQRVGTQPTLLHVDIDVIDPAFAPATGVPEILGLVPTELVAVLRRLGEVDVRAFEVTEIIPAYDGPGQVTSVLGANLCFEVLSLVAARAAAATQGGL